MIRIWAEWDMGQDNCVFTTKAKARAYFKQYFDRDEYLKEEFGSVKEVEEAGLLSYSELEVDP